jgi:endonuclease-3
LCKNPPVKSREAIPSVLRTLARETRKGAYAHAPVYQGPIESEPSPFRTLVSCLISTRTRDEQTIAVCGRLFAVADTPERLSRISPARLAKLLYGAGFYRQKAKQLQALARAVLDEGGRVPRTRRGLLELPGIGPKCANIVLARCFRAPVVAVDTHVHRISNRMGWVRTKTPEETEKALTPLVPVRWRRRVNVLLVAHGQLVCRPIGPRCDSCVVSDLCARRNIPKRATK